MQWIFFAFRNRAYKTRPGHIRLVSLSLTFSSFPSSPLFSSLFFFPLSFIYIERAATEPSSSGCRVPLDARRKFRVIFPARLKNSITAELSVVRASLRALASQRRSLARFFSRLSLLNQFRQRQVAAIRSDRTGNVSRTFTQVMEFSWTLFLLLFSVSLSPFFFLFHREM